MFILELIVHEEIKKDMLFKLTNKLLLFVWQMILFSIHICVYNGKTTSNGDFSHIVSPFFDQLQSTFDVTK